MRSNCKKFLKRIQIKLWETCCLKYSVQSFAGTLHKVLFMNFSYYFILCDRPCYFSRVFLGGEKNFVYATQANNWQMVADLWTGSEHHTSLIYLHLQNCWGYIVDCCEHNMCHIVNNSIFSNQIRVKKASSNDETRENTNKTHKSIFFFVNDKNKYKFCK